MESILFGTKIRLSRSGKFEVTRNGKIINGLQLAKMKKYIPHMPLP